MPITKEKKVEVVGKLEKITNEAKSLVFVNFHGLTVTDSTKLRKELKTKKIGYVVAKKTLLKRALGSNKIDGEIPALDGEVALVYGDDPIEPSREIYTFQKDHKDKIKILGGVFEGKFIDALTMTGIATIPSREVLLGQLVGLLASPIRGLAVVLSEIAKSKKGSVA